MRFKCFLTVSVFFLAVIAFVMPLKAQASARLAVSPSSGNYKVGDKITASVLVDSGGEAINAADGAVTFSSDILEYQSVSTSGSILTFWTSGPTAGTGSITFGGGLSHPGYTGSNGKILTVTFKAKATGAGLVSINDGRVLADDGSGTNIYGGSQGATFAIGNSATPKPIASPTVGVSVKSSTHPDSAKWYSTKTIALSWSAPGITQFSAAFDQSAETDPKEALSNKASKSIDAANDGVWYFHVKGKTTSGFTPPTHFKIQIDTTPPGDITVTIHQDGGTTNPTPKIEFDATDTHAGIDKYTAQIDSGEAFAIKSGDLIPKQKPGHHVLIIKAYDKAGNTKTAQAEFSIEGIAPPAMVSWDRVVSLLHPVTFIGHANPEDVIVVFLEGKEVARFTAKQNQTYEGNDVIEKANSSGGEITWKYTYIPLLAPGNHAFTFSRITPGGQESAQTSAVTIRVAASSIQIVGYIVPLRSIIITLMAVILVLLLGIIYLSWQNHRIAHGEMSHDTHTEEVKEKEILEVIDTTLTTHSLSSKEMKSVKKTLKNKIHDTLHE